MTKRKAVLILVSIPIVPVLSLTIWFYATLYHTFFISTENLEKKDKKAYAIAKRITEDKLFTKGPIHYFRVDNKDPKGSVAKVIDIYPLFPKVILINKSFLKSEYLDVIVAHELGHIEYDTSNENLANQFAAKVCGDRRTLSGLFTIDEEIEKIRQ